MDPEVTEYYGSLYRDYHIQHPKTLGGKLTKSKISCITQLVNRLVERGVEHPRLLDYGSGKGYQYLAHRAHEVWGGFLPVCYDPGVRQLSGRPEGVFDGIISTDVLEHIEQRHLANVIQDIFSYANPIGEPFVYLHTCCRPARKVFGDGVNLHATVQPPEWWESLLAKHKPAHVNLVTTYEVSNAEGERDLPASD